ncbi:adenylyltransferase [Xylariaceae sp. FL0016]|nr:adenylyltransferase [Xylariaceae sp. FL0016]
MSAADKAAQLRQQISQTEQELQSLREQLAKLESSSPYTAPNQPSHPELAASNPSINPTEASGWKWPLKETEYARYARQLILPAVGVPGQLRLRASSVLVVGAGGLGCPAAAYLAGSGVGTLGLVDGDAVELSNLHRQVAHAGSRLGANKVDSLRAFCRDLNPEVACAAHAEHLTPQNAEAIVRRYDVVLDCTDHPTSRYLISDVCVLLGKPLVSASALRMDGQLIVLNNPPAPPGSAEGGPCYRCVFPKPPPAESVVSCGEGGILGPVVGVMGVLQALEAIKLIAAGIGTAPKEAVAPSLLLFSAGSTTPFRSIRMRSRRPNCFACSAQSSLTLKELSAGSMDYVAFCGVTAPVDVLKPDERISATFYHALMAAEDPSKHLLLDVREKEHFNIASIPGAVNVPFSSFQARSKPLANGNGERGKPDWMPENTDPSAPIYVVCRVGNDSQLVTRRLKEIGLDENGQRFIGDIRGGMRAWKQEVDQTLPFT